MVIISQDAQHWQFTENMMLHLYSTTQRAWEIKHQTPKSPNKTQIIINKSKLILITTLSICIGVICWFSHTYSPQIGKH